jgi:PII-like signaling protein
LPTRPGEFPWATFLTNTSGCLALGALMVYVLGVCPPGRYLRPFLGVGFLGGYTTFSTYTVELLDLTRGGPLAAGGRLRPGQSRRRAARRLDRHHRGPAHRQKADPPRPTHPISRPGARRRHRRRPSSGRNPTMRLYGPALRLTIFVGETDQFHHKPLYTEIVHRAHTAGLAGASVIRGIEGYGASSRIHTSRILSLSQDLPLAIIIIDDEDKIRDFLPQLDEIVEEGLVILDPVEVYRYVGRHEAHRRNRR